MLNGPIKSVWAEARHEKREINLAPSFILPPSQIVRRLTFLAPSLTTRLIQKICANIVKFKSFLKNFY